MARHPLLPAPPRRPPAPPGTRFVAATGSREALAARHPGRHGQDGGGVAPAREAHEAGRTPQGGRARPARALEAASPASLRLRAAAAAGPRRRRRRRPVRPDRSAVGAVTRAHPRELEIARVGRRVIAVEPGVRGELARRPGTPDHVPAVALRRQPALEDDRLLEAGRERTAQQRVDAAARRRRKPRSRRHASRGVLRARAVCGRHERSQPPTRRRAPRSAGRRARSGCAADRTTGPSSRKRATSRSATAGGTSGRGGARPRARQRVVPPARQPPQQRAAGVDREVCRRLRLQPDELAVDLPPLDAALTQLQQFAHLSSPFGFTTIGTVVAGDSIGASRRSWRTWRRARCGARRRARAPLWRQTLPRPVADRREHPPANAAGAASRRTRPRARGAGATWPSNTVRSRSPERCRAHRRTASGRRRPRKSDSAARSVTPNTRPQPQRSARARDLGPVAGLRHRQDVELVRPAAERHVGPGMQRRAPGHAGGRRQAAGTPSRRTLAAASSSALGGGGSPPSHLGRLVDLDGQRQPRHRPAACRWWIPR